MKDKGKNTVSKEMGMDTPAAISREQQLEIIFNTSNDIIFLISIEAGSRYRFTSVNQVFLSATGLKKEQVEGKYVDEIIPEPSRTLVLAKYRQATFERQTIQWEETSDYPAGTKTGIVSVTPVVNEQKECTMLVGTVHDITERKKIQEQIIKEKDLSECIINSLPGIFYLQEITGEFLRWNQHLETVTGYSPEEINKMHTLDLFDENDKEIILKKSMELYANGAADLEATVITKNGNKIPHYFTGQLIEYEGRTCVVGTGIDITERKKASEQLLKEKELSESIINSLPGIFYLFDNTGKYLRWNKNHETVPGYSTEEMQTMHPLNFFDEDEKGIIQERIEKVFSEGYADAEANFIGKDGTKTPYYFNGIKIEYEGKNCLMGVAFDITERKRAENELLESEVRFREVLENSISASYKRSLLTNTYDYLSPVFKKIAGYTQEEMNNLPIETVIGIMHPDDIEPVKEGLTRAIAELSGFANSLEYRFKHKTNDEYRWLKDEFVVMQDAQGQPVSLIGSVSDITEQKKIEQELRQAEIKFRTLVEKSQVGVYIVQKGKFTYVNPRFAEIFGYTVEELIDADPVKTIISEEYQSIAKENVRARLEGEVNAVHYEVTGKRKNGMLNRVEFYGSRTIYEDQPTIIGTMIDITERKLAEEALQKSEANLHTIFDTTDTNYALLDNNFQVMSFNYRAADFVEKELHQQLKLHTNLISYFSEDMRKDLYHKMRKVLNGEHINYESSYPQKDGSINWYYVRMFPISNNEGKVFGMMVAVSDITEKKLLEQEIMNQKVQEQKKITRAVLNAQEKERNKIGQELHDNVNQILVGSKMYLGLVNNGVTDNADLIKQSIGLIDNAINEIRALTRAQVTPQRKIDLKDLIQSLVDQMNEHTAVKSDFVYDTGAFFINDDLKLNIYRIIQEAINNILKHAAAKNVVLIVKAGNEGLHIVIRDDGKGFDSSLTTKGIGIANMLNRIESYNGRITIDSSPGNGCKIEITIPL